MTKKRTSHYIYEYKTSYTNGYFEYEEKTYFPEGKKFLTYTYRFPVWAIAKDCVFFEMLTRQYLRFSLEKYCEECKQIKIDHLTNRR